ncbi:flavodoxin-dependent (E)-4-hydroxy-3-methylbut-2-enyl-diphosphate synthase [Clostridium tyrobutyricum]|jgi:(E)-4-hydroxy-3-methylbut-2-enyl-diphosphate synthase|uniref:flavodoxin-dependent (E)-4-hydroxy-3-methylbut-2-enyl-diphosphate synthase n=1 Tax=Clostridium tyrobutyricum TaxID=1519 RepID=UPI0011C96D7D|nr:flavodoxin-dependent (E)-4-hydroxy-3-methylbut-2-enyl-diphosphate synthase [Clostridium tyrobutyricum]MBV4414871.1 flavodoxin-dependent (E)-4-hydroxy-3-methylbut-2-enyl-diphosphate synthase [Clostridium tyrobutyricum]MBV4420732.1 flavodoxin-dependent (E)-4-hydroxy-3-methylbut-2-enyl-diphosphate synthase [Clostridium tyrobutyricum]MBV4426718.1 flavodoxin-dependent (E)-4-hydroxy-3-methylbut-2-enyl-diphosphate synthase [Clostridium tyrobutyricum]MBV4441874.1 flavodoxin-dependent (E)-4-hydroxy-3
MSRSNTKKIKLGNIFIGGDSKITVQSMTNTDTRDRAATIKQIKSLEKMGCDIVRCAVPDIEACTALKDITKSVNIPVVADIHFDYRLAIKSIENGVFALRINPGNIGSNDRVKEVAKAAQDSNIPIRIGVNSGSLNKDMLKKYGGVSSDALVESALNHVKILENVNFDNIVISIKSSNVIQMVDSYRKISKICQYPLHLGVTEAGTGFTGTIKSSVGIGTLLMEGIGDTIRVSLTGDPIQEVKVGKEILKACGLRKQGIELISCPTCGRTEINIIKIAEEVERRLSHINKNIRVAVMGCVVNGPGEAREADIGIAGGKGEGLIFKNGNIIKKVREENLVEALMEEIQNM